MQCLYSDPQKTCRFSTQIIQKTFWLPSKIKEKKTETTEVFPPFSPIYPSGHKSASRKDIVRHFIGMVMLNWIFLFVLKSTISYLISCNFNFKIKNRERIRASNRGVFKFSILSWGVMKYYVTLMITL